MNNSLTKIAITGGIGSGKTYICHLLEKHGFPIFYCDLEAKKIIHENPEVKKQLTHLVGNNLYDNKTNQLRNELLSEFIRKEQQHVEQINQIVHPYVAKAFLKWCEGQKDIAIMECAILFESKFDKLVDKIVLISANEDIRMQRLRIRSQISNNTAKQWMALQVSNEYRKQFADLEIINNGATLDLTPLFHFLSELKNPIKK